jgi:hypothetical protein
MNFRSLSLTRYRFLMSLWIRRSLTPWHIFLQIATFISSNVEGVQLSSDAAAPRGDPFTSGGRYVPGAQSGASNPAPPAARGDPFTSGDRYVPSAQPAVSNGASTGTASHPFLSPNAYSSAGVDRTTSTGPKLIPKVCDRGFEAFVRRKLTLVFLVCRRTIPTFERQIHRLSLPSLLS